jgi:hypothetical protein
MMERGGRPGRGFFKWDGMRSGQIDAPRRANGRDGGFNGRGIDGGRLIARQAQQHSAVCGVAQPGEGQRAVQLRLHARNAVEQAALPKLARKAAGRAHGPHGMRTRRTDADFVQVEETRGHG